MLKLHIFFSSWACSVTLLEQALKFDPETYEKETQPKKYQPLSLTSKPASADDNEAVTSKMAATTDSPFQFPCQNYTFSFSSWACSVTLLEQALKFDPETYEKETQPKKYQPLSSPPYMTARWPPQQISPLNFLAKITHFFWFSSWACSVTLLEQALKFDPETYEKETQPKKYQPLSSTSKAESAEDNETVTSPGGSKSQAGKKKAGGGKDAGDKKTQPGK